MCFIIVINIIAISYDCEYVVYVRCMQVCMLLIINRLDACEHNEPFKWVFEKWQNLLRNLWFVINQVNAVGALKF